MQIRDFLLYKGSHEMHIQNPWTHISLNALISFFYLLDLKYMNILSHMHQSQFFILYKYELFEASQKPYE